MNFDAKIDDGGCFDGGNQVEVGERERIRDSIVISDQNWGWFGNFK